ncbi:Secretory carrier-associated membrane protein 1 [Trichinella spiralis]|uniref:Secretory carrier-associated membrane protein n=3 Tax=Trichinella TaxID=6333 RepID=A0A0V1AWQ2_TRISP|nr:Secretory carrier-associated membrane protein 1 [Trichinella spiralis]
MSNFLQIITIPVLLGALSSSMIDAVCQERQVVKEIAYGFQWHKMLSISTTLAIPELDKASIKFYVSVTRDGGAATVSLCLIHTVLVSSFRFIFAGIVLLVAKLVYCHSACPRPQICLYEMSNLEGSPFGDPVKNQSPFADPSVVRAAKNVENLETAAEYNPFAEDKRAVSTARGASNPPPILPTSMDNPPVYSNTAQPPPKPTLPGHSDLLKRQEELERKAQELQRKEEELNRQAMGQVRNKNWPPLPSWFPLQPCFYHDISVDIPQQYQRIVRMGYNLWLIYVLTLVLNVVGSLASFITHGSGLQFGLSIIQVAMFTPCSFVLWYRPLYKAFKNDSSFNFMVYFFVMFLQLVFVAIQSLGIESFGTCGWFNSLGHFGLNAGAAVLMLIVTLGFTFCGVGLLLLLFRVHRLYRSTGASFAKAQQEFSQGVINNPHVQQAAATAAGAAVRNQFAESGGTQRY